ncbi:D-inositol-3-phosphate glycosyltransferase [Amycolatopsis sp. M39]|nr:D-inositol-3-phosphate glycosyltransferase [Amycolatopsis sp. M39]
MPKEPGEDLDGARARRPARRTGGGGRGRAKRVRLHGTRRPGRSCRGGAPAGCRVVHVPAGPALRLPKDELVPHMENSAAGCATGGRSAAGCGARALLNVRCSNRSRRTRGWRAAGADLSPAGRGETAAPGRRRPEPAGPEAVRAHGRQTGRPRYRDLLGRGVRTGSARVPRQRISVVPCGVDLDRFGAARPGCAAGAGGGDWCRARDSTCRSPRCGQAPETELVLAGGSASAALSRNPGSEWPAGCGWQVRCAGTTCLRCCVRRTRCCARLGTSSSGRFRWKQWPMAVGGLTDTVVDGITGRLVPPRDPARLAAQLRALPDDPAELEALGTAEQKRFWARYSWDRIAAGDRAGRLCRRGSPDGRRGDAGRRRARAAPSPESRTRVNRVPPRTAPSSTAMAPESLRAAKSPSRPSAVGTMNSSRLVSGTENPALPRTS